MVLSHTFEVGFPVDFVGSSLMLANHLDLLCLGGHPFAPCLDVKVTE